MDRRRFLATSLTGVMAGPLAAEAQQLSKVPRIGMLDADRSLAGNAFHDGLRQFGYVEGKNIAIEWRWASSRRRTA
jgi:hypothetical protein